MKLFYRKYGDSGAQPLLILHGLFGTSDNWVSYSRRIADEGFEVFALDQRNHGQSPKSPAFNYLALTDDLYDFIEEHKIENPILLGHSLGGKVAMRFTLENPEMIKRLVVVDISLKSYPPRREHLQIVKAIQAVDPSQIQDRQEAEEKIAGLLPEMRLRQFVLKSLHRTSQNGFEWRLNIDGIAPNLNEMFDGIELDETFEKPTLFIKGGLSNYILLEDFPRIRKNFPHAEIITIDGTSHWVQVEAPERFFQLTSGFMNGNPSWFKAGKQGVIRN
ncbi:MAG: alpha/beta fold hydrolase [Bacteroidales bacterium]|nr:alpha/beta fold hydrolase [Bacteroidales bacterium]